MRKAAYVVAAVVVVFLLLVGVLPRIVSMEGMRSRIIKALEEKSGRKASFSKVSLSLFPGIGVKVRDLKLSGDPGSESESLLDVHEAEFRLGFLAFLSGRAEFSRIILTRPAIRFRSYPDGATSISGFAFPLATIDIREARVAIRVQGRDGVERVWEISPVTARVTGAGGSRIDFDLSALLQGKVRGHLSLAGRLERERANPGSFLLKAAGDLFRQDFSVEGKIIPAGSATGMELTLSMPRVRMGDLSGIFTEPPAILAEGRPEGFASFSARLAGTPDDLGFEVDADLRKAGWTVMPGLQKFIDMPCTLVVQGHRFPDRLTLSNTELRFPPLLVVGNLLAVPSTGEYEWSASSRIGSLEEFAKSRGEMLKRWTPTGRLTASGQGKRRGRDVAGSWNVRVDLGDVGFQQGEKRIDFRSLEGQLVLSPGAVEFSPLAGLFNGQRFTLRGKMALGETAAGPLDLKMAIFDLDTVFPEKGIDAGKAGLPKVAFLANLSIDAGLAKGVPFRDLSGQVRFEKGVHSFEKLKAKVYGGEAEATGRIDTTGAAPDFRASIALRNVEAAQLLANRTTLKDFISGPVTMTAELSGGIRDFSDFSRTAAGNGNVSISGGTIRGIDLAGAAAGLAGLSSFMPSSAAGETPFSALSAGFRIAGGKISTDSLRIDSDRFGLEGSAVFAFDKTVDLIGRVRLPASLTGRVRETPVKFRVGRDGRIEIPLVVSGALTSPAMAVDSGALAKGKEQF